MKKKLFFLAVAAVALASCSNDETIASQANSEANEISFRPLTNNVTRAYDIANASALTSFKVQAFLNGTEEANLTDDKAYFSNVTFTGPTTYTSGDTKYYWPSTNLDFYAWSVHSSSNNPTNTVTRNSYKAFVVTPGSDASIQPDLVFACSKNVVKNEAGVPLYFKHTESRIILNVKNSNSALSFKVEGWQVGGLYTTGTFTHDGNATLTGTGLIGGTWTLNTDNRAVSNISTSTFPSQTIASNASTKAAVTGAHSMILIPQGSSESLDAASAFTTAASDAVLDGSYIAVKMSIWNATTTNVIVDEKSKVDPTTGTAGGAVWAFWPVKFNWQAGKQYTYTIDLADGGYYLTNVTPTTTALDKLLDSSNEIKFVSVEVSDWGNGGETTLPNS